MAYDNTFCPMLSHYTTAGGERHLNDATRDVMHVIFSAGRAIAHSVTTVPTPICGENSPTLKDMLAMENYDVDIP
jgi:hypothetical protein